MSFLDDLDDVDRALLVGLPYRVGLFVSQSDASGGSQSDVQELQALANILGGYAGEVFGCETVQYVISETMSLQDDWPKWNANLDGVEADCVRAIEVLSASVDEKEVAAFKQHLMEVGEAVALAFREVDVLSFVENIKLKFSYQKLKYQAKKQGRSYYRTFDEFLHISADERNALQKIAGALDIEYAI